MVSDDDVEFYYIEQNLTAKEVARILKTTVNTIYRISRRNDWKKKTGGPQIMPVPPKEELHNYYVVKQLQLKAMARIYRTNPVTVWQWLKKLEIPMRPKGGNHMKVTPPSKEELYEQYITRQNSREDLANLYDVGTTLIGRWLTMYEIRKHF